MSTEKLLIGGVKYTLKTVERETGSNYNVFVTIHKEGSKMPNWGTTFKDNASKFDILEWATDTIKNEHKNLITLETIIKTKL